MSDPIYRCPTCNCEIPESDEVGLDGSHETFEACVAALMAEHEAALKKTDDANLKLRHLLDEERQAKEKAAKATAAEQKRLQACILELQDVISRTGVFSQAICEKVEWAMRRWSGEVAE